MRKRRVKVTGIGPVTPAGIGATEFWQGVKNGRSYIRRFDRLGLEGIPMVAATVAEGVYKQLISKIVLPRETARHTGFAVLGASLALADAGLAREELEKKYCAVVAGASLLDFGGIGRSFNNVWKKGAKAAQPRVVFTSTLTSIAEEIASVLEINSKPLAVQTSCCAGLDAIGQASRLIESGEVDIAICGGTEAPLHAFPLLELRAAGLTPSTNENPESIARPFDLWRTTGVVSEGACFFVLEPEESPRKGYAWLSGYSFSADSAGSLCSSLLDAASQVLANAKLRVAELECLSAWGPGHRLVDKAECVAMERLLKGLSRSIPAFSIKGAIGSPLGAAPAIQVAAALLGMRDATVIGTVNWENADPECCLSLSKSNRRIEVSNVLVNAHGVGGVNSSILFERC